MNLIKELHPTYFELNIHERINARHNRNFFNINSLFSTVLREFDYIKVNYATDHPCTMRSQYHHYGKRHSMYTH